MSFSVLQNSVFLHMTWKTGYRIQTLTAITPNKNQIWKGPVRVERCDTLCKRECIDCITDNRTKLKLPSCVQITGSTGHSLFLSEHIRRGDLCYCHMERGRARLSLPLLSAWRPYSMRASTVLSLLLLLLLLWLVLLKLLFCGYARPCLLYTSRCV